MGLDMWLRAKTKKMDYEGVTGACSGLFGLAPDDNGMVELGYWRKAYDQQELIFEHVEPFDGDDNCQNIKISKEGVEAILDEAKEILATHEFDEDGFDVSGEHDYFDTWMSKQKWEDTIEFFTKARELLDIDPDAEIYYCQWY